MASWGKHRAEFTFSSQAEYESAADLFLSGAPPSGVHECIAVKDGRRKRYDPHTNDFGVWSVTDRCVVTFFRPDPVEHGFATNLDYFFKECV